MAELRSGLEGRRAVAKSGSVGLGGWLGNGRYGMGRMVVRRAVARAGSVGVGQNASRRVGMRLGMADMKDWDVGAKLVWRRDRA
jgi:hypothetical protein